MPRLLYSLLLYLLTPLSLLRLLQRSIKAPAYRQRIAERYGFYSQPLCSGGIWVHAVSVGESIAAKPLIEVLLARYPDQALTLTCTTPTGSQQIQSMFADRVQHVYAPYDTPDALARFLAQCQPRALVIMETELWPNTVAACKKRGIPVVLANGRMSEKSARGYAKLGGLSRPLMASLSAVAAQSADDARRFIALGARPEAVERSGSIKFDIDLPAGMQDEAAQQRGAWQNSPVWIAASTHEGEDEIVLRAFAKAREHCADLRLILVPRHPERFERVAKLITAEGFSLQRRSTVEALQADTAVLLGDTMGELLLLFGLADIAFIGGSLVENGGHNSLEAAVWGLPILTGESDYNFAEISQLLQEEGALSKHADAASLADALVALALSKDQRVTAGAAGLAVLEANRGALARQLALIEAVLA